MKYFLYAILGWEILALIAVTLIVALTIRKPIFWLIQMVNAQLLPLGWVICLWPHLAHATWIFWNDDDPPWEKSWWDAYTWLAWRNPVDNFKHVKWTQAPYNLPYKTWMWRGKQYYYKVGWMSNTYAAMSIGAGRGY